MIVIILIISILAIFILVRYLNVAHAYRDSTKKISLTYPLARDLAYIQAKGKLSQKSTKFANRRIGFIGDSVTYGFDDENNGQKLPITWTELIGLMLHPLYVFNGGHNSASVMAIDGTPWSWSEKVQELSDGIDILGVLIGINDAFRYEVNGDERYALGHLGDKNPETFHGSLWMLYSKLQKKYVEKGKQVFMLVYPYTDQFEHMDQWVNAMYDTAEYFHIKVCDLSKGLRLQPQDDLMYEYWGRCQVNGETKHSPHVTQKGSYLFAEYISEWMIKNID